MIHVNKFNRTYYSNRTSLQTRNWDFLWKSFQLFKNLFTIIHYKKVQYNSNDERMSNHVRNDEKKKITRFSNYLLLLYFRPVLLTLALKRLHLIRIILPEGLVSIGQDKTRLVDGISLDELLKSWSAGSRKSSWEQGHFFNVHSLSTMIL